VKVDRDVEIFAAKPASEGEVVRETPQPAWTLDNDQRIDVRVVSHDCFGSTFDEIGDGRFWKLPANGGDGRRREDDIADQAKSDEQNLPRLHPSTAFGMTVTLLKGQGSTVASSISITGMSSLIGYTR
jgi:hypothetical protein